MEHSERKISSSSPTGHASQERIEGLLEEANKLSIRARRKEKALLKDRIALGELLIELKNEVGHGHFISKFKEWVALKKLNFSLKTGQRAMAYAALSEEGKLDSVSNLADAERVRKDEADRARKTTTSCEEEEAAEKDSHKNLTNTQGTQDLHPGTRKLEIKAEAKAMADHISQQWSDHDPETRITLLKELTSILTKELEKPAPTGG